MSETILTIGVGSLAICVMLLSRELQRLNRRHRDLEDLVWRTLGQMAGFVDVKKPEPPSFSSRREAAGR